MLVAQPGSAQSPRVYIIGGRCTHPPGRRWLVRRFHTARERSNPVVPRTPRISIVANVNLAKYGFQFHKYFWPRVWWLNSQGFSGCSTDIQLPPAIIERKRVGRNLQTIGW
jgi:hypothetical protein